MYWPGQNGKGCGTTGSGWGSSAGKGRGAAWGAGKGAHWGGANGEPWNGEGFTGSGDHWGGAWGGKRGGKGNGGKTKKEKNYHNCTYLGCGRHRLPHEDQCTLAGLTLDLIFEDTGIQIPSIVVAAWTEKSCLSFFFLLSKAQPSTRLQQMVPRGQQFTLEAAAEGLIQMWRVLIQEPAKREEQARLILQWCLEDQEKMVAEAMKKGMEQLAEAVPGALPQGAPVPGSSAAAPTAGTRALVRLDTDEEYERTKKKKETWMMKAELAEIQQKLQMASSSHRGAEAPQEHQEQAETKAEKTMEKQKQVEAAVSVITEALKQQALSPPGG